MAEFWEVTPREFELVVEGVRANRLATLRERQHLVYAQAVLTRIALGRKKMPEFEEVFPDPDRADRVMSADEIGRALEQWAALAGGPRPRGE